MIMSKKGYLFIILIAFGHSLAAQKEEKISVSVTSTPFPAFVKLLEEKTTTRFYYNQTNLDSFFVTVDATELTLADILQKVFVNTPYQFLIRSENRVYITREIAIQPELPEGFF